MRFRRPSLSKLTKSLVQILVILCISLILVEVLMTVFEPNLFKGFYQYDPDLGFRVRAHYPMPDGSVTNQFGFNAREYSLQKSPGVFRILVVGDSFVWAGGLNGNYTTLLERKLDALDGGHKTEVISAGYPGTHTGEQLLMLKKFALQYNPDMVILSVFAGNDFLDADPNRKRIIVNDTYVDIDKRYERRLFGRPIILNSRLLMFLQQKIEAWKEQRAAAKEAVARDDSFSRETFLNIEKWRLDFFGRTAAREKRYQPNIDYVLQSTSEMHGLLRSRNIAFMVVIFPDEFQVNQDVFKAVIDQYQLDPNEYDLEFAQKTLKSFLDSQGILYLDFLDRFRAAQRQQSLYIPQNTHLNDAGNKLAAEILVEILSTPMSPGQMLPPAQ